MARDRMKLKIKADETKVMVVKKDKRGNIGKVTANGDEMQEVEEFKYSKIK